MAKKATKEPVVRERERLLKAVGAAKRLTKPTK